MELPWEDNLLERKVESDLKDVLKTLVAFSNSVRPGHVATLLIGERDDGTVSGVLNPDAIQDRVRREADKIYPPPIWRSAVYEKQGKHCVRVEVEFSGTTPHFGGPAWLRRGSSTVVATDDLLQRLIEIRLDPVRLLAEWAGREITVSFDLASVPPDREPSTSFARFGMIFTQRWSAADTAKIVFLNQFWVTLETPTGERKSEPLGKLTLTYDDKKDRLKLIVSY